MQHDGAYGVLATAEDGLLHDAVHGLNLRPRMHADTTSGAPWRLAWCSHDAALCGSTSVVLTYGCRAEQRWLAAVAVCQAAKDPTADEIAQEEEGVGQLALPGLAADLQAGREVSSL